MSRNAPEWKPNLNSPIPQQWQGYVTQLGAGLEIIPGHLYDTEVFTSGTTRELTFFTSLQVAGAAKNQNQTNMKVQGALPWPESMLLLNMRVYFKNDVQSANSGLGDATDITASFNDLVQLVTLGVINIEIGEKKYGPFLPWALPANSFVKGAFSTGSDLLANYGQVDGLLYPLVPPLVIAAQQQFKVVWSWPQAAAITLSVETLPLVFFFDGQRARALQ
jgi:hypothetical protein